MVRIESLSQEEINKRENASKLAKIAEDTFPDCEKPIDAGSGNLSFQVKNPGKSIFYVTTSRRVIDVYDKVDFDDALKLAKVYESTESDKGEWTVKKNYQEF